MKAEIISRTCIKPSSPTPPHLKTFTFSLLDQLCTSVHANMTFFYPSNGRDYYSTKSHRLQRSLSESLTRFYPLAGRLQDSSSILCNDDGAYFLEAKTEASLSDFLDKPNTALLEQFLPEKTADGSLLLVQFTLFGCGGTALSISHSHNIVDLAALAIFLKSWTAANRRHGEPVVPDFCGASLLPPREIPSMAGASSLIDHAPAKFVAKRLVFEKSKIAELRTSAAGAGDHQFQPTRGELVLAVIWQRAMAAWNSKLSAATAFRPTALFQGMDLRSRVEPRMPETAFGNFMWPFMVVLEKESDTELHAMVKKMRDSMNEFLTNKASRFKGEEAFSTVMECLKEREAILKKKTGLKVYKCSSGCKFPLYETDFGWGKPAWMTSVNKVVSNTISLLDTSSGGVEAFVTLDEDDMAVFQKDEILLSYASLNPTVTLLPPPNAASSDFRNSKL